MAAVEPAARAGPGAPPGNKEEKLTNGFQAASPAELKQKMSAGGGADTAPANGGPPRGSSESNGGYMGGPGGPPPGQYPGYPGYQGYGQYSPKGPPGYQGPPGGYPGGPGGHTPTLNSLLQDRSQRFPGNYEGGGGGGGPPPGQGGPPGAGGPYGGGPTGEHPGYPGFPGYQGGPSYRGQVGFQSSTANNAHTNSSAFFPPCPLTATNSGVCLLVWKPPRLLKVPNPLPSQTSSENSAARNFHFQCVHHNNATTCAAANEGAHGIWQLAECASVCRVNMHDTHSTESHPGHLSAGTFTKEKKWMCTRDALNLNKLWHSQCHLMMSCTGHKRDPKVPSWVLHTLALLHHQHR